MVDLESIDRTLGSFLHIGDIINTQPDHMILMVHLDITFQYYNNFVRLYGKHVPQHQLKSINIQRASL